MPPGGDLGRRVGVKTCDIIFFIGTPLIQAERPSGDWFATSGRAWQAVHLERNRNMPSIETGYPLHRENREYGQNIPSQ